MTVRECFEAQMERFDTLATKEARSKESSVIYRQKFKKFCDDYPANVKEPIGKCNIADKMIREISRSELHQYFENITTDFHLSRSGLRDAKTALSKAYQYAINNDIVASNLVEAVDTSDIYTFDENVRNMEAYTDDEVQKLLDIMTDETVLSSYRKNSLAREAAAALCYETQVTVRAGETRALRVSDVCLDEGSESVKITSFIRRSRDENGKRCFEYRPVTKAKSRKGDRTPALSDFAKQIIVESINRHPDDEYVFSSNGKQLPENCLAQWLRKFCTIAGVEYRRPHCLRCTTITALNSGGINKTRMQHSAGQLCPTTTDRYIDASRSTDITKEEANRIFQKPTNY